MIIEPKILRNVCLTAHPLGCSAQVQEQIEYVRNKDHLEGTTKALIVGSSNGYGLAARILSAYGCGADTVGVAYERPGSESKPGSAGWYNDIAFRQAAEQDGLDAWSINGDAFSQDIKDQAVELLKKHLGGVELVVYSIASPRRMDPKTGTLHSSVIKPIGKPFVEKTVDFQSGEVSEIRAEPASSEKEIADTVKVMGGEDWALWIEALEAADLLAEGITTVAFSYIGSSFTAPIYRDGTIGEAKKHLEQTAGTLNRRLARRGGRALVSVNKALVTRASAVIPAVPLYIALLYRVMKDKGLHEACIQQIDRLFRDFLYSDDPLPLDTEGRIRLDDREMLPEVQEEVYKRWRQVTTENLDHLSDIAGFREEYLRYHGFGVEGIDYRADVEP
ncbi:MAG: trans-2-enoyl-CoA reductase family protein [Spirochaetaceae bacterium]|nr:MAG: trans-2-enoyl-CoA reductase family protein [Spirochaetaceae bacterium]